jgi:hypothetical protein
MACMANAFRLVLIFAAFALILYAVTKMAT